VGMIEIAMIGEQSTINCVSVKAVQRDLYSLVGGSLSISPEPPQPIVDK